MKYIHKSQKLHGVCYDIRGPVLEEAYRMEEAGQRILKLNIGNPAPFGLMAPDEILKDVVYNLPQAEGYSESKGMFAARKAVMHETQRLGIAGVQQGFAAIPTRWLDALRGKEIVQPLVDQLLHRLS